ncbi:MAG: aldo/keto reductase [Armatimonadetes bacterium]|nr:aldo/keto reductase [Armatimonadota bacterium]
METVRIPGTGLDVSRLIFGCMRLPRDVGDARVVLHAALEAGIDFFDHADIYGGGQCETVFGHLWADGVARDAVTVQSKCGIRQGRYDFSYEHITAAVEGSLKRLQTDYLDLLLLHRPDVLMAPEEVATAFDELHAAGKVRHFGVSNFTPAQIELLGQCVNQPLVANQIQLSLAHLYAMDSYIVTGYGEEKVPTRGEGVLEYAMLNAMSIQAYGPLGAGRLCGTPVGDDQPAVRAVAGKIGELAAELGVSPEAVACAWLMRHPAGIQPIIGTMNPHRIRGACRATEFELTREQWYALYVTARGKALP